MVEPPKIIIHCTKLIPFFEALCIGKNILPLWSIIHCKNYPPFEALLIGNLFRKGLLGHLTPTTILSSDVLTQTFMPLKKAIVQSYLILSFIINSGHWLYKPLNIVITPLKILGDDWILGLELLKRTDVTQITHKGLLSKGWVTY